eukprot:3103089-Lingulodinium_polyedra.AAC.1
MGGRHEWLSSPRAYLGLRPGPKRPSRRPRPHPRRWSSMRAVAVVDGAEATPENAGAAKTGAKY